MNLFVYHLIMLETASALPTVYFVGGYPACTREVAMYRRQPSADAVEWVDVAHCGAAALGADLIREAAMARLHLRRIDVSLIGGAQAFTSLWRLLPRSAWLGRALGAGPGLLVLETGYRIFLVARRGWLTA